MENNKHIKILEDFLKGEASPQEVRYLLSELDNPVKWDGWAKEKWLGVNDEIDARVERKMLDTIRQSTRKHRFIPLRRMVNIAAAILILFLSGTTLYLWKEQEKMGEYQDMIARIDKGQKATITLPDNTVVWINSGSELRYGTSFNTHERRVHLSGEAYFEVAHRENCPFTVVADDIHVTAVGTSFNVKAYPEERTITALLVEGGVVVDSPAETFRLSPSQMIVYDRLRGDSEKRTVADMRLVTAWRDNKLVLEDRDLFDISNTLSRQYNITFRFADESLKKFRYGGTINNNDLNSILQMLSLTSPLAYEVTDSVITFYENKEYAKTYGSIMK